jgi:microcystin-dependent protein
LRQTPADAHHDRRDISLDDARQTRESCTVGAQLRALEAFATAPPHFQDCASGSAMLALNSTSERRTFFEIKGSPPPLTDCRRPRTPALAKREHLLHAKEMNRMSNPFLGELRIMSFNFAPKGWALANGQLLPINQNQPLFALFGTTYGGDGRVNFALPDLRGRVPVYVGQGITLGQRAGEENHTLNQSEMAAHTHSFGATTTAADQNNPAGHLFATAGYSLYNASTSNLTPLHPQTVTLTGGSQPHSNMQPYLVLNFCVALQGIFPSRN